MGRLLVLAVALALAVVGTAFGGGGGGGGAQPQPSKPPQLQSPVRSSRTVTVGPVRFGISADARVIDDVADSLRTAAAPLKTLPLGPQSVTVQVAALHTAATGGRDSCRLAGSCRSGTGDSVQLGSITRIADDALTACREAARELGEAAAHQCV